ncbi:MAG TPA: hypothetical protein ENK43_08450 [Planctomycetes bacterium]|nr:hypothetical protein [Planctomycetota bacterium]
MVNIEFDPDGEGPILCEGCGTELPAFLDHCPYCDDEDSDQLPCPECGAMIHEDSEQCPRCKAWVTMRQGRRPQGEGLGTGGRVVFYLLGSAAVLWIIYRVLQSGGR